MTEAFVVKTFIYAMDGIGVEKKRVVEGDIISIADDIVDGLVTEGYITIGDDIPIVPVEEEIPDTTFTNSTEEELIAFLEEAGEELTGEENKSTLIEMCEVLFSEDD